jgi:Ca-activated chloride channel family protein
VRERPQHSTPHWRDEGPWLVLALLPLVAALFRRGWLVGGIVFVLVLPPGTSYALSMDDLWLRKDQQGQHALKMKDYGRAAELFDDPARKGAALYRAHRYDDAAQMFARVDSADGHYNRGNALVKAGRLQEALAAYQETLRRIPTHADARYNKALIEEALKHAPQPQSAPRNGDGEKQRNDADGRSGNDAARGAKPADQFRRPGVSPEGAADSPETTKDRANKQPTGEDTAPRARNESGQRQPPRASAPAPDPAAGDGPAARADDARARARDGDDEQSVRAQAAEQWLRSVPDDPGGLLREKFRREHLRRAQQGGKP